MKKQKFLSVAILSYNGLEYLEQTLPAVLDQDYENYEVIVVDNGSTDGSLEYLEKQQKIKLIKNSSNLGYSKGKNLVVRSAQGEFVLLLDEDILIEGRGFLSELIRVAEEKNDFASLSMLLANKGEDKTEYYGGFYGIEGIKNRKFVDYEKIIGFPKELVEIAAPDGGALLVNRKLFLETGGYDESRIYFCDVGDWGPRATILTGKKHFLYTKTKLTHLGAKRKIENKAWCQKYKFVFLGGSKVILKNYSTVNMLLFYPCFCFFMVLKTIKQLIFRKSFCVVSSFCISVVWTVKELPEIFAKRKEIQTRRILGKDVFLKVGLPKFAKK